MKEILLVGFYQPNEALNRFLTSTQQEFKIPVRDEQCNGWQRAEVIRLEQDIFTALAAQEKLYVYKTDRFWSQIKSAGSAIYASRLYLNQYHKTHPERLAANKDCGPKIIGNVYVHPTANIDPSAVDHSCVLNSIIGWDSTIGKWARVEGTPSDPNPNDPYAKIDSETLFRDGKLTPSITILDYQSHQIRSGNNKQVNFISKKTAAAQLSNEYSLRTYRCHRIQPG
ncbi:Mannose-1-phosphate guanyltransferase alpha-A [Bagarius yarrelli]|uniref:Mannose-1-phosphate guanyltransferase alpha-A n=1 Tax=Bagarius yarrelli TaxID=175774 RepID=A0A556TXV7_BAGYA|nr:Mannose-1-phosphate guanyltransferase alpha-A [Bagarius yarrelli]